MSWQQELYQWLREADREWMTLGELFAEVEAKIPLHVAMRYAVGHYGEDRVSGGKAQWLYFTQMVSHIGVEIIKLPGRRHWTHGDQVRLMHIAGHVCPKCAGPVVRGSWTGKNMVCLACARGPVIDPQPLPPKKVASPRPVIDRPLPVMLPPSSPVTVITLPAEIALPTTPGQQARGPLEVHDGGERIIAYRRTLARSLKPYLNVSINRLEQELERHRNDITAVLALHGKTTKCLPAFFVAGIAARARFERMLKNGSEVIERIFKSSADLTTLHR